MAEKGRSRRLARAVNPRERVSVVKRQGSKRCREVPMLAEWKKLWRPRSLWMGVA
jgi:hypothetical protein